MLASRNGGGVHWPRHARQRLVSNGFARAPESEKVVTGELAAGGLAARGATAAPPSDTSPVEPVAAGSSIAGAVPGPVGEPAVTGRRFSGLVSVELLLYVAIGVLALLSRFWDLGTQAQHHDESLHSYFSWLYYTGQGYIHDPLMHGPFLFHVAAFVYFLFGDSDATSRYGAALFGAATVVLPYLLRKELGRWGALIASVLLLTSPSFLYFGRFHRHDVYSAFFTLLIFATLMRFIDSRRPAWLIAAAATAGLLFTNKEDFFIVAAIFGSALAVAIFWRVARRVIWFGLGLLVILALVVKVLPSALGWTPLPHIPWANPTNEALRAYVTGLLINPVILSASLLLLGFVALIWSYLRRLAGGEDLTEGLFAHDEAGGPVAALYAALRDRRVIWAALGTATAIYVVFYTSVFTNIPGIFSGSFGAIGYWLGQQGVRRAEQPWFYYLLLVPQYDPLAALLGGVGIVLTAGRQVLAWTRRVSEGPQPFARGFIAYWAVASLAIYSWAGEKMPWMDIHMVLPLLLMTAALLGTVVTELFGRVAVARSVAGEASGEVVVAGAGPAAASNAAVEPEPEVAGPRVTARAPRYVSWGWVTGGAILAACVAWFFGAARLSFGGVRDQTAWWLLLVPFPIVGAATAAYAMTSGWRRAGQVTLVALSSALLLYHVHAGWALAYQRGDVAKDMLVYVQTSPDVTRTMDELNRFSAETTGGKDLVILYDSNTSWPFQWYLRDYRNKLYFDKTLSEPPADDVAIVLVGNENLSGSPELAGMLSNYVPQQYSMRWHFPEDEIYRPFAIAPELPVGRSAWVSATQPHGVVAVIQSVFSSLAATTQPVNQGRLFRLLAYRDLWAPLGSYDFTVYVRKDLLPQYNAIRYR